MIASPKNDEETYNIEVSDNFWDESDLKIPLPSHDEDDISISDNVSIYAKWNHSLLEFWGRRKDSNLIA